MSRKSQMLTVIGQHLSDLLGRLQGESANADNPDSLALLGARALHRLAVQHGTDGLMQFADWAIHDTSGFMDRSTAVHPLPAALAGPDKAIARFARDEANKPQGTEGAAARLIKRRTALGLIAGGIGGALVADGCNTAYPLASRTSKELREMGCMAGGAAIGAGVGALSGAIGANLNAAASEPELPSEGVVLYAMVKWLENYYKQLVAHGRRGGAGAGKAF